MGRRETCLWIFPVRWAVFIISFIVAAVSAAIIAITFLHRNRKVAQYVNLKRKDINKAFKHIAMMIHLAVIHTALPWVYIIILAITGVIGIFGLIASLSGSHGFMVMYKIMFWLMTFLIVYIWQIIIFILALVNRTKTTDACNKANPNQDYSQTGNANVTVEGYTTTLLGLNYGETYGLANCDQAVEAGVIGIAICLFVGGLSMTWFAFIVNKCVRSLDTNSTGSRARNARWNDNLEELQSSYARDRKNAPKYPLKDLNGPSKFSRGLMKMKLKKSHK